MTDAGQDVLSGGPAGGSGPSARSGPRRGRRPLGIGDVVLAALGLGLLAVLWLRQVAGGDPEASFGIFPPYVVSYLLVCAAVAALLVLVQMVFRRDPEHGVFALETWYPGPSAFVFPVLACLETLLLDLTIRSQRAPLEPYLGRTPPAADLPLALLGLLVVMLGVLVAGFLLLPVVYLIGALLPPEAFEMIRRRQDFPRTRRMTLAMGLLMPAILAFTVAVYLSGIGGLPTAGDVPDVSVFGCFLAFVLFRGGPLVSIVGWIALATIVLSLVLYRRDENRLFDADADAEAAAAAAAEDPDGGWPGA